MHSITNISSKRLTMQVPLPTQWLYTPDSKSVKKVFISNSQPPLLELSVTSAIKLASSSVCSLQTALSAISALQPLSKIIFSRPTARPTPASNLTTTLSGSVKTVVLLSSTQSLKLKSHCLKKSLTTTISVKIVILLTILSFSRTRSFVSQKTNFWATIRASRETLLTH